MDQNIKSAVHNRPVESFKRMRNMTMDVMIPDEIKSGLISDATLDRHKTDANTSVKYKTGEETPMTVEYAGELSGVKVEPVLNSYMTNLVGYGNRKEPCPVKTEPVVDAEMANASPLATLKWDASIKKSPVNGMGNVRPDIIDEGTDTGKKIKKGVPLPAKVKLEPGEGTETAENQSRMPPSAIYPVKMESGTDMSVDIIKGEPEISVERTETADPHLYSHAKITAAQWPKSTATENIPVDAPPNMYLSATGGEQRPGSAELRLLPVNMPDNPRKIMDHVRNSTVKRLHSPKFVQNVPSVATSAGERIAPAETVVGTSLRKTSKGEYESQTSVRNRCQVLSNVPEGMSSAAENQIKSQAKTFVPAQILPHLPIHSDGAYQVHSQAGLKRIIPVKIVQQASPPAVASTTIDQVESSDRKFIPGHMMSNVLNETTVDDTSAKRRNPLHIVKNSPIPHNGDFHIQPIVQKISQVKTAPDLNSGVTNSLNHVNSNEMFKFPVKIESGIDLGTSTAIGSGENASMASEKTFRAVGGFIRGKHYENNVEGPKWGPPQNTSGDSNGLMDVFNARTGVFNEFNAEYLWGMHAVKTLPTRVGSRSNAKIDDNSVKINMKQAMHIFPRFDQAHMESFQFVSNEMRAADKLKLTPTGEVSAMSPVGMGIKPKPFRKPRKEKLEVKNDVEFEIIPVGSAEEENLKSQRDKPRRELEIPAMPPEVAAELTDIAKVIEASNKTAAELVQDHGPRVKELWKFCRNAFKRPGGRGKTNRRQEFKAWVTSAGEPGIFIMKTIAKSVADYTRKRREKIKQLAEAGDPEAMEVFSRVLLNRRKFIEKRRALREAGGPVAVAMAQRARERERKRRAQKALMKSANCCHGTV